MDESLKNEILSYADYFWLKAFSLFTGKQVPDSLFAGFEGKEVPYFLTMGIAAIFFALALWLCLHTAIVNKRLAALNKKLSRIVGDHPAKWRENFRDGFNDIELQIQNIPFLRRSWQEFDESVIRPDPADEHSVFRNTARAGTYFNISSLARTARLPLHFWQAAPNYFVGFGLLFTFLGLAAALNFASDGVSAKDIEIAKAALQGLLQAATFKFLTSITGLAASIMFSMLFKWRVGRLQRGLAELCDTLEKGLTYCTHEGIAYQQLAETKRQTPLLEWFKSDFAISVAGALQKNMNESLPTLFAESMKPLTEELRRLAGNLGQMNMNGLEQMITRFSEKLEGSTGTEMKAITVTLEDTRAALSSVAEQMRSSGQHAGERLEKATIQLETIMVQAGTGFGANMQQAATNLQSTIVQTMTHLQDQLSLAGNGIAGNLTQASSQMDGALRPFTGQLESFTATLKNFGQEADRQQQALKGTALNIQTIAELIGSMMTKLKEAATPIAQTSTQFETTARAIQAAANSLENTQRQLGALLATIHDSNQKLTGTWQEYRQRFEGIDEDLAKAFNGVSERGVAQLEEFRRYANELDSVLQKALSGLAGGIDQMKDTIEDMAEQRKTAA